MDQATSALFGAVAALGLSAPLIGGCASTECLCASTYAGASLIVQPSSTGSALANVQARSAGDITGSLICAGPAPVVCAWPPSAPEDAGSYNCTLQVGASGYRSVEVPATVTVTSNPSSCCPGPYARLSPSTVTLERAPDGG